MEDGMAGILESVTLKTLHAYNFSRSSSEASHVLTDLLSRYISLLAATCAQYAEHAGRTSVGPLDAVLSLEELGVSVDELKEYGEGEGREMSRYTTRTARRMEELAVLKDSLSEGLRQDHDDAVQLVYAELPSPTSSVLDALEENEVEESFQLEEDLVSPNGSKIDARISTPPLPPSPISNPSSPFRKRARLSNWNPPSHIPDFLPPYPDAELSPAPSPIKLEAESMPPPNKVQERPPTPPPQLASSTTTSDYLTPVPYTMSSLSSISEHHLPDQPPGGAASALTKRKYETPQITPTLIKAYHHVLTNRPPPNQAPNPSRHRVAMALLLQMYNTPRWTAADTLFSNLSGPRPRVVAPAPSFPVANEGPSGKEKDKPPIPLPIPLSRSLMPNETLTAISTQATSRIPDIARIVLPPSVLNRTTKLNHPPPLVSASGEKLKYGLGVPAPWNSSPSITAGNDAKDKGKDAANGKESDEKEDHALPDATLYATWNFDTHDFRQPIPPHLRNRGRANNFTLPGHGPPQRPTISIRSENTVLSNGAPSRKNSKVFKDGKGR